MLHYFLVPLARHFRVLNVFTYISFRAVGAAVTSLLLSFIVGPIILRALARQSVHQVVREGTPESHAGKGSTPTMGGLIILFSSLISVVLWGRFSLSHPYLLVAIFITLWMVPIPRRASICVKFPSFRAKMTGAFSQPVP